MYVRFVFNALLIRITAITTSVISISLFLRVEDENISHLLCSNISNRPFPLFFVSSSTKSKDEFLLFRSFLILYSRDVVSFVSMGAAAGVACFTMVKTSL